MVTYNFFFFFFFCCCTFLNVTSDYVFPSYNLKLCASVGTKNFFDAGDASG